MPTGARLPELGIPGPTDARPPELGIPCRPVPELPEVETIRMQLLPRLSGRRVVDAGAHPSTKFASAAKAVGSEITGVRRRGKYLIIALAAHPAPPRELVIHLGMTGRLSSHPDTDLSHPHLRAWWLLDDESVFAFHDIRRFGRVSVVAAGRYENIVTLNRMGPEPFSEEFTGESLWRALQASQRHLKTQLLSQRPVAGVGNIYADEALWLAGINPVVRRLSLTRATKLATCIQDALSSGLRHGGTTLRDYVTVEGDSGSHQHHLRCYGHAGESCNRCGTTLRRRVVDARGTTWCPYCQRR